MIEETRDIETCLALRHKVFVEEQGVTREDEIDGMDAEALHFLAHKAGCPVGTLRMLLSESAGKIGRVCVLPEHRGVGHGAALIQAAIASARAHDLCLVKLGAQTSVIPFYEKFKFKVDGPEYFDAGIPHRDMVLPL